MPDSTTPAGSDPDAQEKRDGELLDEMLSVGTTFLGALDRYWQSPTDAAHATLMRTKHRFADLMNEVRYLRR